LQRQIKKGKWRKQMKNLEQFDVMTDEALSTVEGGKSFFYDFGYWYGSHASLSNLANNLGRMLRS
jgi:bacteriocin-like protein